MITEELTNNIGVHDIGGTAEVAELLECPKQQIHALRKNPAFPTPVRTIAATPLWLLSDISSFKSNWKRRAKRSAAVSAV